MMADSRESVHSFTMARAFAGGVARRTMIRNIHFNVVQLAGKISMTDKQKEIILICDGCNVREPWEHRCHGNNASISGIRIGVPCMCNEPSCKKEQAGDLDPKCDIGETSAA